MRIKKLYAKIWMTLTTQFGVKEASKTCTYLMSALKMGKLRINFFQEMVLRQLDIHMQKKSGLLLHTIYKNYIKMDQRPKYRHKYS